MSLPTKDTKKRFKKLMKDSGKSKTNTDAGATDTSKKKISTNEKIMNFEEYLNEATFKNDVVIGIDIDGTINNFSGAYNTLYKRYFPEDEVFPVDDWFWYMKMNYGGLPDKEKQKWFKNAKAETFDTAQPYDGAVISVNNIYDFVKTYGFKLNIVTNQVTEEARTKAKIWLDHYGFKYDDIVFVSAAKDKWKHADIMVDDADKVLGNKPLSKVAIKIEQTWNTATTGDISIPNIKALSINIMKNAIEKLKNKTTL